MLTRVRVPQASLLYYAIKSVDKAQRASVLLEVGALREVSHRNVMRFHAWCAAAGRFAPPFAAVDVLGPYQITFRYETSNHLWLILELCVGGTLAAVLAADGRVPEGVALEWGRSAAAGLRSLHARGVIHAALAPDAVLLDEAGGVKLTGLACCCRVATAGEAGYPTPPTLCSPPERLRSTPAPPGFASDLWALGCLLYECVAGRCAFIDEAGIATSHPPPLPEGSSDALLDIVEGLLTKAPGERYGWSDVEAHPFWGSAGVDGVSSSLPPLPKQTAWDAWCASHGGADEAQPAPGDVEAAAGMRAAAAVAAEAAAEAAAAAAAAVAAAEEEQAAAALGVGAAVAPVAAASSAASAAAAAAAAVAQPDAQALSAHPLPAKPLPAAAQPRAPAPAPAPAPPAAPPAPAGAPAPPPQQPRRDALPSLPAIATSADASSYATSASAAAASSAAAPSTPTSAAASSSPTSASVGPTPSAPPAVSPQAQLLPPPEDAEPAAQGGAYGGAAAIALGGAAPPSPSASAAAAGAGGAGAVGLAPRSPRAVASQPPPLQEAAASSPVGVALQAPPRQTSPSKAAPPAKQAAAAVATAAPQAAAPPPPAPPPAAGAVAQPAAAAPPAAAAAVVTAAAAAAAAASTASAAPPAAAPPPPPGAGRPASKSPTQGVSAAAKARASSAAPSPAASSASAPSSAPAPPAPSPPTPPPAARVSSSEPPALPPRSSMSPIGERPSAAQGSAIRRLAARPGGVGARAAAATAASAASTAAAAAAAAAAAVAAAAASAARGSSAALLDLDSPPLHATDAAVRPLVHNRRIEAWPSVPWEGQYASFRPMSVAQFSAAHAVDSEAFLHALCRALNNGAGATPTAASLGVGGAAGGAALASAPLPPALAAAFGIAESLATDAFCANALINGGVGGACVRLLSKARPPAMRTQAAALLALLLRHATLVGDALAGSPAGSTLASLCDALKLECPPPLRRRAAAALGELLFYIATADADRESAAAAAAAAAGGGSGDGGAPPRVAPPLTRAASPWLPLPPLLPSVLARTMRDPSDPVAAHYAAAATENVTAAGGSVAAALSTPEVAASLLSLASSARGEHLRATAASALARAVRTAPCALLSGLAAEKGASPLRTVVAGLADPSPKAAASWLSLLCSCFALERRAAAAAAAAAAASAAAGGTPAAVSAAAAAAMAGGWPAGGPRMCTDASLLAALSPLLDAPVGGAAAPPVRAKASFALAEALKAGGVAALEAATDAGCLGWPHAPPPPGDDFAAKAASALDGAVADAAPRLLAPPPDGSPFSPPRILSAALILSSPRFAHTLLPGPLATALPPLLASACAVSASPSLRDAAHALLEALAGDSPAAVRLCALSTEPGGPAAGCVVRLMPTLAGAARTASQPDTRFLALRAACDLLAPLLAAALAAEEEAAAGGGGGDSNGGGTAGGGAPPLANGASADAVPAPGSREELLACLERHLLPAACAALGDADGAIPLYALKLAAGCLDFAPSLAGGAHAAGATTAAFTFLHTQHACCNVHNARLCLLLAACPAVPTTELTRLGAAKRTADVLEYASGAGVDAFIEPALGTARALLERHAHDAAGGHALEETAAAAAVGEGAPPRPQPGAADLLPAVPLLCRLCAPDAPDRAAAAELAADCLALLLASFPARAAALALSHGGAATLAATLAATSQQACSDAAPQLVATHTAALGAAGLVCEAAAAAAAAAATVVAHRGTAAAVVVLTPEEAAALAAPLAEMAASAREERVRNAAAAVSAALQRLVDGPPARAAAPAAAAPAAAAPPPAAKAATIAAPKAAAQPRRSSTNAAAPEKQAAPEPLKPND